MDESSQQRSSFVPEFVSEIPHKTQDQGSVGTAL